MDRARWAPAADGGVDSLTGTSSAAGTPAGRGGSGRSAKGAGRRRAVPSCVAPCVCLCVSPCVSTSCARVCGAVCLRGRSRGAPLGQPPSLGRAAWPRPAPRVCLQHCGARPVSGGPGLHWPQPTDLSTACAQVTAQRALAPRPATLAAGSHGVRCQCVLVDGVAAPAELSLGSEGLACAAVPWVVS